MLQDKINLLDRLLTKIIRLNDREYQIEGKYIIFAGDVQDIIRNEINKLKQRQRKNG